jgi:hypothetical protein
MMVRGIGRWCSAGTNEVTLRPVSQRKYSASRVEYEDGTHIGIHCIDVVKLGTSPRSNVNSRA